MSLISVLMPIHVFRDVRIAVNHECMYVCMYVCMNV